MNKREATIPEMKNYFGCPGRPTGNSEMMEFWKSLTDAEKTFYKEGIGEILDMMEKSGAPVKNVEA